MDDDQQILILMRSLLREFRFDVATASTGEEALRLIDRERPDLMLLDINLPDLRGEAVIAAVRARDDARTLPIVVLSGERLARLEVKAIGADLAVQKPFDINELRRALDGILSG